MSADTYVFGVDAEIGERCNTEAYVSTCEGAVVVDYVMTVGAGSKGGYVCDTGARVGSIYDGGATVGRRVGAAVDSRIRTQKEAAMEVRIGHIERSVRLGTGGGTIDGSSMKDATTVGENKDRTCGVGV